MHWFLKFIFGMKLYMFRTVPLYIIMRCFSLYTQQWYMSYRFADSLRAGSGRNCSSILILFASCQQNCMTYTIAVCTVKNSRWWTEELSETCRILFQEYIWGISASSWFFYIRNDSLIFHLPSISVRIMPTRVGTSRYACHLSGMISEYWKGIARWGLWTKTNVVLRYLLFMSLRDANKNYFSYYIYF